MRAVLATAGEMKRAWLQVLLEHLQFTAPLVLARARRYAKKRFSTNLPTTGTLMAVAAAALIAAAITVFTAASDRIEARAQVVASKGENPGPIGSQCSQRAWPYYETHCVRGLRPHGASARPPRVVTTERR